MLLRVVFELPASHPKEKAKVFGGWEHPSAGDGKPDFHLSWPVSIVRPMLMVDPFIGYLGKPYQALQEYDYLSRNFPFRDRRALEGLDFRGR